MSALFALTSACGVGTIELGRIELHSKDSTPNAAPTGFPRGVETESEAPADTGEKPRVSVGWNEPPGFNVVLDCGMETACAPVWDLYKNWAAIPDSTAPHSPSGVLDDAMLAGQKTGGGEKIVLFSSNVREIYSGAWWKTNADFEGSQNNANKIYYVGGAPGNNSMFMWNGLQGRDIAKVILFGFQTVEDNCHVSGYQGDCYDKPDQWGNQSGSGWLNPNVDLKAATVMPGSGWHRLELFQRASSTKTSRDGVIRWWVDGVLAGDYRNLNYSPGGFDNIQINHAWDGGHVRDFSLAWHHYWDYWRVSTRNCPTCALD